MRRYLLIEDKESYKELNYFNLKNHLMNDFFFSL